MLNINMFSKKYQLSMKNIMMISMWGLIAVLVIVFSAAITASGLPGSLNDANYRMLRNHVEGNVTGLSLEFGFVSRVARHTADNIQSRHGSFNIMTVNESEASVKGSAVDAFFRDTINDTETFLKNVPVTGVFIILDNRYADGDDMAAMYLRNANHGTDDNEGEAIVLVRGSPLLWEGSEPRIDESWLPAQPLANVDADFITEPMAASLNYDQLDSADWGYWSKPFRLDPGDIEIITYTTPLVNEKGEPFGVFGVELSLEYLSRTFLLSVQPYSKGFYMIAMSDGSNIDMRSAFSFDENGASYIADHSGRLELAPAETTGAYPAFASKYDNRTYFAAKSLNLYADTSPFAGKQYYLYAAVPEEELKRGSNDIIMGIAVALMVSIIAAMLLSFYVSGLFSKRLKRLVAEVRNMDPEQPLEFSKTNIKEVDELSWVLVKMSQNLLFHGARMSEIVDLVGIPMGAFEIQANSDRVFMTGSLFRLLEIEGTAAKSHYIAFTEFLDVLPAFSELPSDKDRIETETEWKENRWLRMRVLRENGNTYGTVVDISEDVRNKKFLQYERDYDPLTKLLNRNSYPERMNAKIYANPEKTGVLLFGDLDSLKHLNDTYGHDMGDRYIQTAAEAISRFSRIGGVVARISGDEFAVYVHGFENRQELREIVDDMMKDIRAVRMRLPDETEQYVKISVGLSYYPDDARDIETLIKYSDFAMYEVKHSEKGGTREFNIESYEKDNDSHRMLNHLDFLIRSGRLKFAMQPLIDASSGLVIGYEALMRPQIREISSPAEVLVLAKSQSKLAEIETLSLTSLIDWLYSHKDDLGQKLLFINTMSGEFVSESDLKSVRTLINSNNGNIIVEINMGEIEDESYLRDISMNIDSIGCKFAIDDVGAELSGLLRSFATAPVYAKVKMSLIRNIHNDKDRQETLRGINECAEMNGVKLIAKGVETYEELEAVISAGVKYVQGFYLGLPNYELGMHLDKACSEARELYEKYNDETGCQ